MQTAKQLLHSNKAMDFSARIREAIVASNKSQATIAREIGVSQSAIAQYLSGHVKNLKAETAARFEEATGYSATWLVTGKGPKMPRGNLAPMQGIEAVPLISWVQAGNWSAVVDNFSPGDAERWLQCPARHTRSAFALRVRGDSMFNPNAEPSFRDGDIIFVEPTLEAMHRSLVVVRLDDEDEATFKQLLIEGPKRYLQALNPNWPERIFPIDGNATLSGVVIGKFQSYL